MDETFKVWGREKEFAFHHVAILENNRAECAGSYMQGEDDGKHFETLCLFVLLLQDLLMVRNRKIKKQGSHNDGRRNSKNLKQL